MKRNMHVHALYVWFGSRSQVEVCSNVSVYAWVFAKHVRYKHILCDCEGDPVCTCISSTAVVQEKSGLTTCTVLAMSIH